MYCLDEVNYRYTVENERLTMAQIKARLSHIHPHTVRKRLYRGLRTWLELGGCTSKAAVLNRKRLQGEGGFHSEKPLADVQEDEENFKFGAEFEDALDSVAPGRHLDALLRDDMVLGETVRYSLMNDLEQYA